MKKYQIQNSIGSGNFSTVFKGIIYPQMTPCAIKVMKSHHKIALRQAQLLKKLKHPNVVSIIDFQQTENQSKIILQYVGINTLQLYETNSYGLRQEQVKCILFQVLLGLNCIHSYGIIHRDVKPQNILIDKKSAIIKLIDFGLAINQNQVSTDYIATRWYRAPQNLLGTREYSCVIDVFSLGCVIVQLYLGSPLFPGQNNIDQIYKIFNILGYPTVEAWPKGYQRMMDLGIRAHNNDRKTSIDLKSIMNPCDPRLVQIVQQMLCLNPKNRAKCSELVKHQYFKDIKQIIPPAVYQRYCKDFLLNESHNLYSSEQVKINKCNGNQIGRINFHNKSLKIKNPHNQNITQNIKKVTAKPLFLKQNKSSSLDQGYRSIKKSLIKDDKSANLVKLKQKPLTNYLILKRKRSTPALKSNLSQFHRKNSHSNFQNKRRQTNQEGYLKKDTNILPQQHNLYENTLSTLMPQSIQNTSMVYSQTQSKKLTPNTLQSERRQFKPFCMPQMTRNNTCSLTLNSQLYAQNNKSHKAKSPMMISPQVSINCSVKNNGQSLVSSVNNTQCTKKQENPLTRPLQINKYFEVQISSEKNQLINSSKMNNLENKNHRNYIQKLVKEDLIKKTQTIHSPPARLLYPVTTRQNNYPNCAMIKKQHTTSIPQITYKSPTNHESIANKTVLSPPYKLIELNSQNQTLRLNKQRKLITVNSPPPQSPTSFFSQVHKKL